MPTQFSNPNSGFEQGLRHGFGTRSLLNSDPALPVLAPSFTVPNESNWNEPLAFTEDNRDLVVPATGVPFREDIFQPVLPTSPQQSLQQPRQMHSIMSTPSQNHSYNSKYSSNTMTSDPVIGGYNSSLELQETARLALGGYGYVRPMQKLTPDISPKNMGFRTQNHPYTPSQRKLQEEKWTLERIRGEQYDTPQPSSPSPNPGFSDSRSMSSLSEPINDSNSSSVSDLSDPSRSIPITPSNITSSPIPHPATSAARPGTGSDSAFTCASVPSLASQPDVLAFSLLLRDLCTDAARRRYHSERLRAGPDVSLSRLLGPGRRRVHHSPRHSRSRGHRASPYSRGSSLDPRAAAAAAAAAADADADADANWQLLDYVSATVDLLCRRSLLLRRRWRNRGPAGASRVRDGEIAAAMSSGEARERFGAVREMQRLWAAGMGVQGLWEAVLRGEMVGREEMGRVVVLAGDICGWVGE